MPSTFLIDDSLEFVARYQYAGADEDDLSLNQPLCKRAGGTLGEKGSENHTLYAGLNYYLCGNNSKVQVGVSMKLWTKKTVTLQMPPLSGPLTACISRTSTRFINNLRTPA